jgi:hypothetical protein
VPTIPPIRTVVLWQTRSAFKLLCLLALFVGKPMVATAAAFKACGRAQPSYGIVIFAAQLALLVAWMPTRMVFLVLERAATSIYATHVQLHRRGELK